MVKVRHIHRTNELRLRETRCQQCGYVCTPEEKREKMAREPEFPPNKQLKRNRAKNTI